MSMPAADAGFSLPGTHGSHLGSLLSIGRWTPLILGLCVAAATWASITLTRSPDGVSAIWIGNGLLLGALVMAPDRDWPRLTFAAIVGTLGARLLHGDALVLAIGICGTNMLESLLVARAIRVRVPDIRDPGRLPTLARVAIISTVLASVISALLAASVFGLVHRAPFGAVLPVWFVAHLLGMVLFGTLTVTVMRLKWRLLGREGHRADLAACVGVLFATCAAIGYQRQLPVLFLAYLPLMLLTMRHGFAGVIWGVGVLALAAAIGAGYELGPFAMVQHASVSERALLMQLFVGAGCLLTFPIAVSQVERRRLARQVRDSEALYRLLAEHAQDLVVRMTAEGRRPYVSASAPAVVGWTTREMEWMHPEWIHPDDRPRIEAEIARLFRDGGSLVSTYRTLHKAGHWIWLEATGRRVEGVEPPEIVYAARDVSARVAAEQALKESQAQLQAVADNMPAMIAHFDDGERFTFANAAASRVLGVDRGDLLGRTLREVRGEARYAGMAEHVAAVLHGEARTFEGQETSRGELRDYRSQFMPDIAADGTVRGFYSLTLDITALKNAERALERMARFDALTGLANRRHFEQSLAEATARAQRNGTRIAVMMLDIDKFKQINDTHGHAAGDMVLKAFATRLRDCVYDVDLPARLGGDEFVVLVEYSPSVETGERVARRITECMRTPMLLEEGLVLAVTTSIGVGVHYPVRSAERVLAMADEALYEAKRDGRATWRVRADPGQAAAAQ
jgi:diguanylate cyclase (GGDEF)-like protein/PAS domain S-box-containing protein